MKLHLSRLAACTVVALLATAQPHLSAHAAISGCTVDPVVSLSNGATIHMTAQFGAPMAAITSIVWSLSIPHGVEVRRTVLDPMIPGKERLVITHNGSLHTYRDRLLLAARPRHVPVLDTMTISPAASSGGSAAAASTAGVDNQMVTLGLSF